MQPSRDAGRRDRADTPVFPSQAAHAMINITPQSYGIQTDPETDFFLFQASRRPKGKCNFRDESSIEIGSQKLEEGWDERRVARRDEAVVTIVGKNFGQKVVCRIETNGMGFLCFPFGCSSLLLRFEARLMICGGFNRQILCEYIRIKKISSRRSAFWIPFVFALLHTKIRLLRAVRSDR